MRQVVTRRGVLRALGAPAVQAGERPRFPRPHGATFERAFRALESH